MSGVYKVYFPLSFLCFLEPWFKLFFLKASCSAILAFPGTPPTFRSRNPILFKKLQTWGILRVNPVISSIRDRASLIVAGGLSTKAALITSACEFISLGRPLCLLIVRPSMPPFWYSLKYDSIVGQLTRHISQIFECSVSKDLRYTASNLFLTLGFMVSLCSLNSLSFSSSENTSLIMTISSMLLVGGTYPNKFKCST